MTEWFKNNGGHLAHLATFLTFIVLAYSVFCLAQGQLQWQNFNEMNVRYTNLLREMPIADCDSPDFNEGKTKIWVRQYFDLYSEELWLHKKKLIPEKMWKDRVRPGVVVNLKAYPILIDYYRYWKDQGAFSHPFDFGDVVEEDIKKSEMNYTQDNSQYHCVKRTKTQSK
ncbi:hypothetical protein C8R27_11326 [Nitrosomonas ureae]|uniref:hypothetical protein n=1 Tax=Nitrosomonas ureae TaxID=44577 RepID=UPI000D75C36F|nr:hypothetical protein [Nitrosomonas ureae]PXX14743.1 hypothetical protein C8R27_11326 [Nitrosomonas ureae]